MTHQVRVKLDEEGRHFFAMFAHEMGNSLAVLHATLELARARAEDTDCAESIDRAIQAATHVREIMSVFGNAAFETGASPIK